MSIEQLFDYFNQLKVLIIGDVMIDSYVWGDVSRISPEAPVPIVNAKKREFRLGGAANVALNVNALGAKPILCSVIGNDPESKTFEALLLKRRMEKEYIVKSSERVTTVKHRILSGSQHILRIDSEITNPISEEESKNLLNKIKEIIDDVDVIIFEDYDKGVLTPKNIHEIIRLANGKGVPTIVDPKKRNFLYYAGSTLFKPNLKELKEGLNIEVDGANIESVKEGVYRLREQMGIDMAMITLSQFGVFISDFDKNKHIPAHRREIADVSGAGDTVVSIAALCLAAKMPIEKIAGIANLGGGLVCEHLGVIPINKAKLLEEASKIFV